MRKNVSKGLIGNISDEFHSINEERISCVNSSKNIERQIAELDCLMKRLDTPPETPIFEMLSDSIDNKLAVQADVFRDETQKLKSIERQIRKKRKKGLSCDILEAQRVRSTKNTRNARPSRILKIASACIPKFTTSKTYYPDKLSLGEELYIESRVLFRGLIANLIHLTTTIIGFALLVFLAIHAFTFVFL